MQDRIWHFIQLFLRKTRIYKVTERSRMRVWISKGSPSSFSLPAKLLTSTPCFFVLRFLVFSSADNCFRVVLRLMMVVMGQSTDTESKLSVQSSIAAIPGNTFPSKYSSIAPPPVLT